MTMRTNVRTTIRSAAIAAMLATCFLTGCKSKEDKAVDQAKAQAASTNTAQQVQYVDKNGDTVTTIVQPPAPGQTQQVSTAITPPAPGPIPHRTDPVITQVGGAAVPPPSNTSAATTTTDNSGGVLSPNTAQPQVPPAPAAPVDVEVASGTELAIRINQSINVKHAYAGEKFSGEIVEPVSSNGIEVIPKGTPVSGRIDAAHRRGHFKGASILELRLTSMTLNGNEYNIDTHDNVHTKKGKGKRSSAFIGGLTGAGMLIGGIATGGIGLAVGAAAGAGTGTLFAGTTGNRDIDIPAESIVHFRLSEPLYVQTP